MADVFPLTMSRTGRKRWTLYNSRGVQRLGSQLAEDGCPDSQVVLAKQLLDETCDVDDDQEENARLGVYWLIKASEQGHEEATNILRHCLETGQGISEHNYLDVKACLDMSQEEKLAQRAARELFATISDGEDFITTCQLQERMLHLNKRRDKEEPPSKEELPTVDWKSRSDGEKLTEDMLISAASMYCRGELPVVQAILSLDAPSNSHFLQEALLHPLHVIQRSYNHLIDTISRHNFRSFLPFISVANLQMAVLVIFYMSVGFDGLLAALPTTVYYLSITLMFISTCQILSKKRDFHNFRRWSNLFIAYSHGSMNAAEAEFQHCRNNLRPYGSFFLALFVHLLLYPLVPVAVLQSELAVVAFFFTFITLYSFALKDVCRGSTAPDFLALFSFGVHVLAKYPYETDAVVSQGWRFLDVHFPTFASYVVGNGVEFCLNFRALFYLVIPAVLLKMAARDNWKGSYMTLIPHCVCLAWWQIAVISSQGATWFGLIRSALALVGLVLFLPLAGLASVLLPVAAAGKFLAESDELVRITTTSVLAALPVLLAYYLGRIKALGTRFAKILGWIQVLLAIMAGLLLVWPALHYEDSAYSVKSASSLVTWEQYRDYCNCPERQLQVQCEIQCAKLVGSSITWEGRVTAARVVRIYNPLIQITNRLPMGIKNIILCFVGEEYDSFEKGKTGEDTSRTPSDLINKCHLANWDRYDMEIDITVHQGSGLWRTGETEAVLVADNSFKNFTKALSSGDRIWFSGVLVGNANGILDVRIPRVELLEIACLSCQDTTLSAVKRTQLMSLLTLKDLYTGIKTILNFLFNPLVIFR